MFVNWLNKGDKDSNNTFYEEVAAHFINYAHSYLMPFHIFINIFYLKKTSCDYELQLRALLTLIKSYIKSYKIYFVKLVLRYV